MKKGIITSRLFLLPAIIAIQVLMAIGCDSNTTVVDRIDEDRMLHVDGKRKFIIGAYHIPTTENPFYTLATNGFNYVRVENISELDNAHKNELFTWIYTGSVSKENKEGDTERIQDLVNNFKDHPALLCWEMEDEPAFTWNSAEARILPSQMQETYHLIKQLDSEHGVITNHGPVNLIATLQQYNSSTDLVACDAYPVIPYGIKPTYAIYPDGLQGDLLNPYISQVGEYVEKMKKVVHHSKPVFMVLQGFAWEMLKEESERDATMILDPSYKESRFMAYNAIVHGANGILYWGTNYAPQPSPFMDDLYQVTRELAAMQHVLAARSIGLNISSEYHELGYSVDAGIELICKKVKGITYVLAVNSDKNPVKVSFNGLSAFSSASVLKENRVIKVEHGKLMDYFEPFDVHIYMLD